MKLTLLLVLIFSLQITAKVHSQSKVTLNIKEQPLEKILLELEKQTSYRFLFNDDIIPESSRVSLNLKDASLDEALNKILQDTYLNYKVMEDNLVIINASKMAISITGKVTDENNETLPGVSIKEKGTQNATMTNAKGEFSIKVASENSVLVFSYLSFETKELVVKNNTRLTVVLKSESKSLNEIVVVGYGSVKKSDITGSVSSVKAADLKNTQLTSVGQALQGRAAGVQVINSDATPGAKPNIRIRGTNSLGTSSEPLFVVDGYPSNDDITSINPNDIESMEVLKDASATAIYGSRGANGVILITTKRGKSGKLSINLESYYGKGSVTKTMDVMNAREYAEYRNQVIKNTNPALAPFASANVLDYLSTHTTNWQNEVFESAPVSDVQLSMSGGDEKTKFLISGEWFKQDGIIRNTGFERGNLRINFDRAVSSRFKVGLTSIIGRTVGHSTNVNTSGGTAGGVVLNALRFNPGVPVVDGTGKYSLNNGTINEDFSLNLGGLVDRIGNPVAFTEKVINDNHLSRGQVSTFGEYEITKELKLKVLLGGEYANGWLNYFAPTDLFEQARDNGTATRTNRNSFNWLSENYLTYNKDFNDKNSFTALIGASFQKFKNEFSTATAQDLFTNSATYNLISGGKAALVNSGASQNQLQSYYTRLNAKLFNNLLLTATLRADGSSKFGDSNKYAYFPSAAAAYKLSEHEFIQKLKVINDLKVRVGYGVTGNQEIDPYKSRFLYDLAASYSPGIQPGGLVFGTTRQIGVAPSQPENPNIKWEQTSSFNSGIDFSLLNNRLAITVDYYTKKTTDLLWEVKLAATTGFDRAFQNLGSIENKGWEFSFSGTPLNTKLFKWNSSFNIALNRNKILSLGKEPFRLYGEGQFEALVTRENFILIKPGQPIGKFMLYEFGGIWQSQSEIDNAGLDPVYKASLKPGYARYIDQNGDNKINQDDKRAVPGSAYPKFVFGFTNGFSFKGFELNAFIQGQQGNKILNMNKYWMEYPVESNKSRNVLNRWNGEGTSNAIPVAGGETSRLLGDDFLEDGSYLRLKSLTFSYQFNNKKWLQSAKVNSLRLYVTGTNLYTLTDYTGYDPEVNSYSGNLFLQGVDQGAYAVARSVIFGVKLGF